MSGWKAWILVAGLAASPLPSRAGAAPPHPGPPGAPQEARVGQRAPMAEGAGLTRLSGPPPVFRDRVVVLAFFATWCVGCVNELPFLAALHRDLNKRGVTVVSVSIDRPEALGRLDALLGRAGVAHTVLHDRDERWKRAWQGRRTSLPYLAVIDRAGVVRRLEEGFDPGRTAEIRNEIELLAGSR